ncbi:MAG: membrane protein insertion efficiency factor YidD [Pseudomonadota bacterium]
MKLFLIACIRIYQVALSPFFGQQCRFSPTCSCYAIGCIQKHGALRGAFLTIKRIARCHPWHAGGSDPVP